MVWLIGKFFVFFLFLLFRFCFKEFCHSRSCVAFCSAILTSFNVLLSIVCLLQFLQVFVRGEFFPVISDFDNPAGVVSYLCLTLPFCIPAFGHKYKAIPVFLIVGLVDTIVVSLIGSRTGLIALTFTLVVYLAYMWRHLGRRVRIAVVFAFVLIVLTTIVLFEHKTASRNGRMLILDVCLAMFRDYPWFGMGRHGFARNYMLYQADFLSSVCDPEILLLSDNVSHPLCEYALLLVNYGLAGFVFFISAVVVFVLMTARKDIHKPFVLMFATSLAFLSAFSYPFRYPMTLLSVCTLLFIVWNRQVMAFLNSCERFVRVSATFVVLVITLYLSIPWIHAQLAWGKVTASILADKSCAKEVRNEIIPITDRQLFDNPRYRYSRAVVNYYSGFLEEALTDAIASSECLSSYDTELLLGDICSALGRYQESEQHYLMASRMCPSKIAPQYCLFKLYELSGEEDAQRRIGNELLNKPVKIMNERAKAMRLEVRMIMALPQSADF